MQLDLFYEISQPPGIQRTEAQAFAQCMAEIVLADSLGFGTAWLVEHHFMRGYSHSSKPDLVLAALSQRTQNIRLGLGITPLPYHHPIHVAERAATLDILSHGRLELGVGRGFSPQEYRAFGADMAHSRTMTAESLDIIKLAFARQPVTYHGQHYQLDALDILPHPIQTPHPPIWSAAVSPDTFIWAAQSQLGMLAGPFKPWLMVKQDVKHYLAAWQHDQPARTGMTVGILCLEDGKRAKKIAKDAFIWFYQQLFATTLPVLEKLYPSYEHFHDLGKFRNLLKLGINLPLLETFGMAVVGTPDECIDKLQKYREAGVTNLLCAVGAGAVSTEITQESMQCLAQDVMPALQN